jgi:hypothetical protein
MSSHSTVDDSRLVNIYLSKAEKETINNKKNKSTSNMSQAYLIQSYDKMRQEYDELKIELAEKISLCDSLEEDNARMEKSITNLRGFVKNIAEINRMNERLKKIYMKFQVDTDAILIKNYNLIYRLVYDKFITLVITACLCIVLWYFNILNFMSIFVVLIMDFTLAIISIASFKGEFLYIKNIKVYPKVEDKEYYIVCKKYMTVINDITASLKDAEKGNDFLIDLIDLQ